MAVRFLLVLVLSSLTTTCLTRAHASTTGTASVGAEKPKHGLKKAVGRPKKKVALASALNAQPETVSVVGHRALAVGAVQSVSRRMIEQLVPGTSPLKILAQMPGMSFSSTDALGIDTWGSSIYVRGFFQDQLGVMLDGIPLNSQSYGSTNGINIINAIISDDIGKMSASQGGGAVDVASNTNLGGALLFQSMDPSLTPGGKITQSFGSNASYRTYVNLNTGQLNDTGTRMFASYSRTEEDKWKGSGTDFVQAVDAKIVQPLGSRAKLSAYFSWNELEEWDYQDYTLEMLKKLGWRAEQFYPNYAQAYAVAAGTYLPPGYASITEQAPKSVSFYDGGQATTDYLYSLNLDWEITDNLHSTTTLYGHDDASYLTYGDPFEASPNGAPLSEEVWQPTQARYGMTTKASLSLGHNTVNTGLWLENNTQGAGQYFYTEPLLGQGAPLKTIGPYTTYGSAFLNSYRFKWATDTFQYFLDDVFRPLPNLSLLAGFRSLVSTTSGGAQYVNAAYEGVPAMPSGSLTASEAFLPNLDADWHFLPGHELYIDIAKNMATYAVDAGSGASPWGVHDQATFLSLRSSLKPEEDWVYTAGYRYTSPRFSASVDYYRVDASHRLQSAPVGTLNYSVDSVIDTGNVTVDGVDIAGTIVPFKGLSFYNSFSYNHGVYDQNVTSAGTTYDLAGKYLVNYPQYMYKSNVTYTWGPAQVHFDANFYSRRYFSYTNDTSVPSYWLTSLGARYRFRDYNVLRNIVLDFNVYNLLNVKYISMMGENGNPFSGDYQSLERGAPRQFFGSVHVEF